VGSWMENTGLVDERWIPHLVSMPAGTYPDIRAALDVKRSLPGRSRR
jgi:hypothetical protein